MRPVAAWRFLIDECLAPEIALRAEGLDARHVQEAHSLGTGVDAGRGDREGGLDVIAEMPDVDE